jgi:anti-sigma regulatory factor (Ser/Thr protein kinase)
MVESAPFVLTVPARLDGLRGLRPAFRGWLDAAGIHRRDADELVLATWEACVNAVVHPLETNGDTVTLTADMTGDRVRIEVRDTGRWREQSEPRTGRGLGLRLVAGLTEQVAVLGGAAGPRVVMWARPRRWPCTPAIAPIA